MTWRVVNFSVPQAESANRQPDCALRGDMYHIRTELADQLGYAATRGPGEADFRVEWDRRVREQARLDNALLVAPCPQVFEARLPRANDAIDLRSPGVGGEKNSQGEAHAMTGED